MDKVLVTGATGLQGSAVARQLRALNRPVRAMVRNTSSDQARALIENGCTLIEADFDQPATLEAALEGIRRAFLVLPLSPGPVEVRRGLAFLDAAGQAGIESLVFSAALDANHLTGVSHFDSKYELIQRLERSGLHHVVLGPGGFMENLLFPQTWDGLARGKLVTPFKPEVVQALVAAEDIGRCAAHCLLEPEAAGPSGTFVPLWSECLSAAEQAELIATHLGRPVQASRLPWFVTRIFLGKHLTRMFDYFNRGKAPPVPDNGVFRRIVASPLSFDQWLKLQPLPAASES